MALHDYHEALAGFRTAQTFEPDYAEAHYGEALLRLRLGEFEVGLKKHEWRRKRKDMRSLQRAFDRPIWLGNEEISGKTILVHAEQGSHNGSRAVSKADRAAGYRLQQ